MCTGRALHERAANRTSRVGAVQAILVSQRVPVYNGEEDAYRQTRPLDMMARLGITEDSVLVLVLGRGQVVRGGTRRWKKVESGRTDGMSDSSKAVKILSGRQLACMPHQKVDAGCGNNRQETCCDNGGPDSWAQKSSGVIKPQAAHLKEISPICLLFLMA